MRLGLRSQTAANHQQQLHHGSWLPKFHVGEMGRRFFYKVKWFCSIFDLFLVAQSVAQNIVGFHFNPNSVPEFYLFKSE